MKLPKKFTRMLGVLIFSLGVLAGLSLTIAAVWADFEAVFYGFDKIGDARLPSLKCPVLMTKSETGMISATFKNASDRSIEFMTRADISGFSRIRSERSMLTLAPGESKQLDWTVTSEDIDLGRFVFAKVSNYPAYQMTFREATCGIVVLDLPGWSGMQVFTLFFTICLLGILVGYSSWELTTGSMEGHTIDITRAMKFLGILVLLGLLISMQGSWLVGLLFIVVSLMMAGVVIGFVLSR